MRGQGQLTQWESLEEPRLQSSLPPKAVPKTRALSALSLNMKFLVLFEAGLLSQRKQSTMPGKM